MKTFIIRSLIALGAAVVITVAVFAYLQYQLLQPTVVSEPSDAPVGDQPVKETAPASQAETASSVPESQPTGEASTTPEASPTVSAKDGIPLSSLPLSDSQQEALRNVNIDPETFIITPEMQACAQDAMGQERYNAMLDGAAPTFLESMSLLRCVQ